MATKKKTTTHKPTEMEDVAVLCTHNQCVGYATMQIPKADAESGSVANARVQCPRCGNALCYAGKVLRNPGATESQVTLLKRDVARLEKDNVRIKAEAERDRIRLEATNNVLDKLGHANTCPVPSGLFFGRGHGRY